MSQSAHAALGSVVSLRRYPIKSMMGEELNAAEITDQGLLGDRAYALVDRSDGKVASAKTAKVPTYLIQGRQRDRGRASDARANAPNYPVR